MCKLNKYLAKIGSIESDICSCGRETESIDHFLFRCPLWIDQRRNIHNIAGSFNRWGDLSFALGGWSGVRKDGELPKWRPSIEMVSATIKFALETKRLVEEPRDNEAGLEESEVDRPSEEEEGSDNEGEDLPF